MFGARPWLAALHALVCLEPGVPNALAVNVHGDGPAGSGGVRHVGRRGGR